MIALHRTTARPPLAIIQSGQQVLVCPWHDLLSLRALYLEVNPYGQRLSPPWIVASRGGITGLTHTDQPGALPLDAADWRRIGELLWVGDDLLTVTEAVSRSHCSRNSLYKAINTDALFAFTQPMGVFFKPLIPQGSLWQWLEG